MSIGIKDQSESLPADLQSLVNSNYRFCGFEEVSAFLERFPRLIGLLHEAVPQVRRIFGTETTINLEVVADPDGRDLPELFASIAVPASSGSALDKLERFDEEWWLSAAQPDDRLHFDVEYL